MCCSPSKLFVVVQKPILLNKISPFAVDFELSILAGFFLCSNTLDCGNPLQDGLFANISYLNELT